MCPCKLETHGIRAVLQDDSEVSASVTIEVSGECVTPTPIDTTGPSLARVNASSDPIDNDCGYCSLPCETDISALVDDPSGVSAVKLVYLVPGGAYWATGGMSDWGGGRYGVTLNADDWQYGELRYYVEAYDTQGNVSTSPEGTVQVQPCIY